MGGLGALEMFVEEDEDVIDLKGNDGETHLIGASRCGNVAEFNYLVEEKNANLD